MQINSQCSILLFACIRIGDPVKNIDRNSEGRKISLEASAQSYSVRVRKMELIGRETVARIMAGRML